MTPFIKKKVEELKDVFEQTLPFSHDDELSRSQRNSLKILSDFLIKALEEQKAEIDKEHRKRGGAYAQFVADIMDGVRSDVAYERLNKDVARITLSTDSSRSKVL
jgi:hypothetical protein